MKRILLPLLFLLPVFCAAQDKTAAANNKSLLWRISGNGLSKPSYLFGTMHIICSTNYLWTPKMEEGLTNSEAICLEMNLDDPNVMTKVAAAMINMDGPAMDSYFTKEQYERLEKYVADSLKMDMTLLSRMKLIGLETMLSLGESACADPVSYEEKIMTEAHNSHKEITGLEEPQEQIALLNQIPTDSIVHDILDIINGKKEDLEMYNQMVAAYDAQDLPALYTMMKDDKNSIGDLNAFLDERNEKWIGRMALKMKKQAIFFAVGAGHLWGKNGVISLLRSTGYKVEPVI